MDSVSAKKSKKKCHACVPLRTGVHSSCHIQQKLFLMSLTTDSRRLDALPIQSEGREEGFGQEIWEKISKMVQQGKEMKEEIEQK